MPDPAITPAHRPAVIRRTTPRNAWVVLHGFSRQGQLYTLACHACGQTTLWTHHMLDRLTGRSHPCKACGTLGQLPATPELAAKPGGRAPDPEAVNAVRVATP